MPTGTEPEAQPGPSQAPAPSPASRMVGVLTLIACPLAEIIGFLVLFSGCSAYGLADFLFVVATLGLAIGGITSLVIASRARPIESRGIGIAAVVCAGVSVPINVLLVGLSGFCVLG